jgi:hypothetical protein
MPTITARLPAETAGERSDLTENAPYTTKQRGEVPITELLWGFLVRLGGTTVRTRILMILAALLAGAASLMAQSSDPRTAEGQLVASGGAANWQAVGFLEFEVKIQAPSGLQGPWSYKWGRFDGVMRLSGPWPSGGKLDVVLDLASRTGGAWEDGKQLSGKRLTEASNWALQRFGEDLQWLTFPLEWGAGGVTVTPMVNATEADGKSYPATEVKNGSGTWQVTLDPTTGRVLKTVLRAENLQTLTVTWEAWRQVGGVYFAGKRTIAETGESVEVSVTRVLPSSPADAF